MFMEGVYIIKNGEFITSIKQPHVTLGLLASCGDIDVMIHEVGPERPSWLDPGVNPELMEFFYIIDGSLTILSDDDNQQTLEKGDCFYASELKKSVAFKSSTGVKMLYFTSKPVFNDLYGFNGDLNELRRRCEEKDKYTGNHSNRVMEYSIKICEKMGLSKKLTETLYVSSQFHDIGKVMIPDEILNKPAALTREEFRYIMKHPIYSRSLIESKFGKEIAEIVEQHHERLDGSGYPFGLLADEIRLEAKIIAVADSYDAMTTDRPYKKAISPKEALIELKNCVGNLYDKNIVKAIQGYLKDEHLI
jgi:HD-GYP domain-containing protein (c-di-GMP phosphodiesterase class II)